ncbi:MAG TPA: anion transporter [Chroococcidiopsis sp.]
MLYIAQLLVLGITYMGLGLGHIPGFRMNRPSLALIGSALLIALGVLDLHQAWLAIDPNTILFLLSIMVVNVHLTYAGFFRLAIAGLLRLTRSPFGVLVVLTVASGVLSAFFLNDTIALVFTPLTLTLVRSLNLKPIPYLLAIAGATNLGSVATLSGNPQNILIGSFSKMGYLEFAQALAPLAIASLGVQIGLLWWLYPEVRSLQPVPSGPLMPLRIYRPLLLKTVVVTLGMLVAFGMGIPLAIAALVAAALLLLTRRLKPNRILQSLDWNLLVLFSGLFILTDCTQRLNLLQPLIGWVTNTASLLGVSVLLSNLVSNVPAVLLLSSLIPADQSQAWLVLAAGSTLAGNLTLFGSIANLIVAEAAATLNYRLSFFEHLRFGLPLTTITLGMAYLWLR